MKMRMKLHYEIGESDKIVLLTAKKKRMHSSVGSCLQQLSCIASTRLRVLSRNNVMIIRPRCESQSATRGAESLAIII